MYSKYNETNVRMKISKLKTKKYLRGNTTKETSDKVNQI